MVENLIKILPKVLFIRISQPELKELCNSFVTLIVSDCI